MSLNLGLVGAGRIAQAYADVVRGWDEVTAVGVVDVNLDAATAMGRVLDCGVFPSVESMLGGADVDAVVICTPPNSHHELTMQSLKAGVHVMCEKPFALSLDEAVEMLALADAVDMTLTMASKFRYVRDVVQAKSLIASGIIGDPILLENSFASRVDMTQRWNSSPGVSGGGVLIDNGTHSVDIARFLLGPITEVLAVEGKRAQETQVEDTAQVFLTTETGVRAAVDLSWSLNKERPWFLEIYGTEGTVVIGWSSSRYRRGVDDDWVVFGDGYDKEQAIRDQLLNFAGAVNGTEELVISGLDALASVEVIEAAYRSMHSDDWVQVASAPGT